MTASIGSILSIARTALSSHQAAIGVISHNLANATTEGYSRQRAELVPGTPLMTPNGGIGTGVRVDDISRLRDTLLDRSFRSETSGASYWGRRSALLGEIQSLHGNIGDPGLNEALDAFWNAWSDLADHPSDSTSRAVVRQAGDGIVRQLHRLDAGIEATATTATLRLQQEAAEIDRLASEIASLNGSIVAAEAGGNTAGDLRDRRDLAVDQLAQLAAIQVVDRMNGGIAVNISGITIVDGADATGVQVDAGGGTWTLRSTRGAAITPAGGSIGATLDVLNDDLPAARAELDAWTRALVGTVNDLHRTGMNGAGETDIAFFDDNGDISTVTASSIRLSAEVAADANAIAAGTPATDGGGDPVYGPGRNDVALALAGIREAAIPALGGRTFSAAYAATVGAVGGEIRAADDAAQTHETIAAQADIRRSSVSGVSTDEELVQLIRFQNAYSAAARVVTAADEMLQTILDMKR